MADAVQVDDQFAVVAEMRRTLAAQRVLKYGDTFGVFDQLGDIGTEQGGEQGLYYRGTRYLSQLELLLARGRPLLLSSTVTDDNVAFVGDLTNVDVRRREQREQIEIPHGQIHVFRARILGDGVSVEKLRICNYGGGTVDVPLVILFDADFADVFEVRGTRRVRRGTRLPDRLTDECLLGYVGLDGVERRTRIQWTRRPDQLDPGAATFHLRLEPRACVAFDMSVRCGYAHVDAPQPDYDTALEKARKTAIARGRRACDVHASSEAFNRWVKRSAADLQMMITETPHGFYPYAGIPWFSTPFGRDGIITALQLLWADPDVARGVLTFLASTQAKARSDAQDGAPGKILHEMRDGEMPALGEVPFGRYYGSIDATPLFVILAGEYFTRTQDAALIEQLWPHLLIALQWMTEDGDPDGDGFLEYARRSENGLVQQGWKDSWDSVFHADGTLADPPIALCEVQGYAYAAWRSAADLAIVRGEPALAEEWRSRADRLRRRFEESFWCDDLGTYALALDGQKRPCRVRTSNVAHCLFSGIVSSPERARIVATSLMQEASFAGWGIRTVAAGESRYNPMSYHNGSIWPHDNAIAAAGLARYGFTTVAATLLEAMLDLSKAVDLHRLPELLCGFHRRSDEGPTLYPVACAPQAWAAGAVYLFVQAALGMQIDAARRRITFQQPSLPESIERLQLRNLVVGGARVDLLLERHARDVAVSVMRRDGEVEIVAIK
ncbi:MAG TPA: glycogen debranching N-terminal domain-containing protein [Vicinamibacterales bacterium]|nr:glycogen debranching N-terminal domain-containing protein [Vicinamibacterales bacterium]